MTYSFTLSATFFFEILLISHMDYCSDPTWSACHCPSPPQSIHYTAVNFLWKKQIRLCPNPLMQKSKGRCSFCFVLRTNLKIFIMAFKDLWSPAPFSASSHLKSPVHQPITRGYTFFIHSTHFSKWIYLSLLFHTFGMPFHMSSARPKFLIVVLKHHHPFRINHSLLRVSMVLCLSCYHSAGLTIMCMYWLLTETPGRKKSINKSCTMQKTLQKALSLEAVLSLLEVQGVL